MAGSQVLKRKCELSEHQKVPSKKGLPGFPLKASRAVKLSSSFLGRKMLRVRVQQLDNATRPFSPKPSPTNCWKRVHPGWKLGLHESQSNLETRLAQNPLPASPVAVILHALYPKNQQQ